MAKIDIKEKIEFYSDTIDMYRENIKTGISEMPYMDLETMGLYSYVIRELKACTTQTQLEKIIKGLLKLENDFTKRGFENSSLTCDYFMLRGFIKVIIKELRGEFGRKKEELVNESKRN